MIGTVFVSLCPCICICMPVCFTHCLCVAHRAQTSRSSPNECQACLSRSGRSILITQRAKELECRHTTLSLTSTRGHCREDPPFWPRSRWNSLRSRSPRRPMVSCEMQTPIRHTHTFSLSFDLPLSCLELFFLHLSVLTLR